jgi:hypothetical protein
MRPTKRNFDVLVTTRVLGQGDGARDVTVFTPLNADAAGTLASAGYDVEGDGSVEAWDDGAEVRIRHACDVAELWIRREG